MSETRLLPCEPVVNGQPTMLSFTGEVIGKFFIHHTMNDERRELLYGTRRSPWTVTHAATGYTVQQGIRNRVRAVALAKELATLDCWDFTDPKAVKSFDPELLAAIKAMWLRARL